MVVVGCMGGGWHLEHFHWGGGLVLYGTPEHLGMVWYHDPHWWHMTPPCFHLKPLQAGHFMTGPFVTGPGFVSMSPESRRRRGRKAGEPLLPPSEKTALGVLCTGGGVECWWWWCGLDRPSWPVWQSRHVPIGVLGFSPLDAGETGLVGAVSRGAPFPFATIHVDGRSRKVSPSVATTTRRRLRRCDV